MSNDLPPEGDVVLELEAFLTAVGRPVRPSEAYLKLADKFGLTAEQRARVMPDGRNHWENRVQFARRRLNSLSKLDSGVGRGLWAIKKDRQ